MSVILEYLGAGLVTGLCVSPLNVVVDKSVMLYASGQVKLWPAVFEELEKLVKSPLKFVRGF